jgi:long-chain acyl-CoA synthetase
MRVSLLNQIIYRGTESIRQKVKKRIFGEKFRHAISGGAKLPLDVLDFFRALSITIYEGYGLTETCVATHVNRDGAVKRGTVGAPFRGIETKITGDGEVLIRGPNVAIGYFNKPEETQNSWDSEGWFHTGDLGDIDSEGYLTITGRKKELIITSGGKKIATHKVEAMLQSHPLVSHAIIVGEGRPFCGALITLDPQSIEASFKDSPQGALNNLEKSVLIHNEIDKHILSINRELASYEQIKRFALLKEDFSIENGLLTPTLKVRRSTIIERYSIEIAELFKAE